MADAEAAQAAVPPSPKVSPSASLPATAALGDSSGLSKETEGWTFVAADGSEEVPPPCPECAAPPPAPFLPAPFSELTNSWVVPPESELPSIVSLARKILAGAGGNEDSNLIALVAPEEQQGAQDGLLAVLRQRLTNSDHDLQTDRLLHLLLKPGMETTGEPW